jgi:hypothetical protein
MSSSNKEKYPTTKQIEEYLPFHNSVAGNLKQQQPCATVSSNIAKTCLMLSDNELLSVRVLHDTSTL